MRIHKVIQKCVIGETKIVKSNNTELFSQIDNGVEPIPDINTDNKPDINTDINMGIDKQEYLHMADVIYEYYPKHSDYDEVKEWFVEERPSKELANIIYFKIKEFKESKQWQKEEGRYIPKLINWLNNKGWLDEVIEEQRR